MEALCEAVRAPDALGLAVAVRAPSPSERLALLRAMGARLALTSVQRQYRFRILR